MATIRRNRIVQIEGTREVAREITQTFFKTVQNKLHWAITGKMAAELIAERAQARAQSAGAGVCWKNQVRVHRSTI